jgi:hypothetical protein
MGVDYVVWVIPKQRLFRPGADQIANLANALRDGGWVPKVETPGQRSLVRELLPGESIGRDKPTRASAFDPEPITASWVEFHSEHELVFDWHVQNMQAAGVQYPFVFDPYPASGPPYFHVRLILGGDYFCHSGENVMPFEEQATQCSCGEQLAYQTGWSPGLGFDRIHHICTRCGQAFDPSGIAGVILDGWTGQSSPLIGGLTFRFALVVDCHKYWPHDEEEGRRFHLREDFLNLWRANIGVPFDVVTTFD